MTYLEHLKDDARVEYHQALLLFALGKLAKPPSLPRVLQDG